MEVHFLKIVITFNKLHKQYESICSKISLHQVSGENKLNLMHTKNSSSEYFWNEIGL